VERHDLLGHARGESGDKVEALLRPYGAAGRVRCEVDGRVGATRASGPDRGMPKEGLLGGGRERFSVLEVHNINEVRVTYQRSFRTSLGASDPFLNSIKKSPKN